MGILNFLKKKTSSKETHDIKRINEEHQKLVADLEYQDHLISGVNDANAKYKEDGDLNALISAYEFAFVQSDPPCRSSQNIKLANFYVKAGMNDKAWWYLNLLYEKQLACIKDIRYEQARIVRREHKYAYAIEFFMLSYLNKAEGFGTFDKEHFLKDIKSCANKIGLTQDHMEYLAYLIEHQVKEKNYSERPLVQAYRNFINTEVKDIDK